MLIFLLLELSQLDKERHEKCEGVEWHRLEPESLVAQQLVAAADDVRKEPCVGLLLLLPEQFFRLTRDLGFALHLAHIVELADRGVEVPANDILRVEHVLKCGLLLGSKLLLVRLLPGTCTGICFVLSLDNTAFWPLLGRMASARGDHSHSFGRHYWRFDRLLIRYVTRTKLSHGPWSFKSLFKSYKTLISQGAGLTAGARGCSHLD